MSQYCKYLVLTLIPFFCLSCLNVAGVEAAKQNEIICKTATIRSVKDFNALQNCTVMVGNIRIVHMYFTEELLKQVLPSNIEEITGYLLVYRVEGLDSLERLLPKLVVIRGSELLYDQCALAVIENRELLNIGLISLLRVLKGSIRVESNPSLCFTHTIDWVSILGNTTKEYLLEMKKNKPELECPLCNTYNDEIDPDQVDNPRRCWSLGKFQHFTTDYKNEKKCNQTVKGNNNCLTSCSDSNCRHCANYISGNKCLDTCLPPRFRLAYERQCVANCNQLGLLPLGVRCVEKCPKHYREIQINGTTSCAINCTGHFKVNTVEDLEGFSDCTTIRGSLTIELFEINKPIIEDLEEAFKNLNEITGYLKVQKSPQLVSLNFFKSLHTIKGNFLIENKYSLYIVSNHHLEELWTNKQVAILKGRVYFHLNPRLCYSKILDLQKNLKENPKITVTDASRNSNGERVVCETAVVKYLTTNVTDVNSTSAIILHDLLDFNDLSFILGYVYYYKESPHGNITKYDGRHGCGQDGWFMEITTSKQKYYILKNLKPYTRYAYFVKPMSIIDNSYQTEFLADLQYFRTLPDKPGPVAKFYIHHNSENDIEVYWWPPRQPNGIIEKYIIHSEQSNDTVKPTNFKYTPSKWEEECQCPKLETESSGATPNEDDYYKKEEGIYTNSLANYIFAKNPNSTKTFVETSNSNSSADGMDLITLIINKHEEIAVKEQEIGQELFVLKHPLPPCKQTNPNLQYQSENQCVPLEQYPDDYEVSGQRHSFILSGLKSAMWYRISIRACVQNVTNGCGPEKAILAQTVSQTLKSVLDSFKFYKF